MSKSRNTAQPTLDNETVRSWSYAELRHNLGVNMFKGFRLLADKAEAKARPDSPAKAAALKSISSQLDIIHADRNFMLKTSLGIDASSAWPALAVTAQTRAALKAEEDQVRFLALWDSSVRIHGFGLYVSNEANEPKPVKVKKPRTKK